jgi:phosphate transport system substrate-binding protein
VDGAGSTWSQIAVDQWRADVASQGLTINYQGVGSTSGRVFYYNGQVDFAVSEIPFQTSDDSSGNVNEVALAARRPYSYMPIVAGGTSVMYHLDVNGQRVRDLRLSPRTLAKIFTGEIRNWNHGDISADNRGRKFPNLTIKPVIRSDGSGTSAQFTAFMASQTRDLWNAFCQRAGLGGSCPPTSLYPNPPGFGFAAQQYSDGVANFVAAPYNNGAITYVEYGYAKQRNFPVASVLNKAGYFVQPDAHAVSIALQGATFNPDGTQNLGGVYTFPDARAYPISSYSYAIVPRTEVAPFNRSKGEVLGKFILYFLCAGQQKAEQLGYSPLPRNLVQNGFEAVRRIPGAPAPPAIEQCNNPTITGDFITGAAPPPPPEDKAGAPTNSGSNPNGSGSGSGSGSGTGAGSGSTDTTTGDVVTDAFGNPVDAGSAQAQLASASATDMPDGADPIPIAVVVLVVAVVLLGVFGPPTYALVLRRRKAQ